MGKNININAIKKQSIITVPVREAVTTFFESITRLASGSQGDYRRKLTFFCDWCESQRPQITLADVNAKNVTAFLAHLEATHTPARHRDNTISTYTLAGYTRVIKRFLNWCVEEDGYTAIVSSNAVARIKKPKIIEKIIETFSDEDMHALYKSCLSEESEHLQVRDRAILSILLDTGIRAEELCTLTLGNVSLKPEDAYIRIFGKGQKWGEVGLGKQARLDLTRYIRMFREPTITYTYQQLVDKENLSPRGQADLKKRMTEDSRVFVNRIGENLTPHGLTEMIRRISAAAGIEGVRCTAHTFRHTFARKFIEGGGDIYTLSKLLRHASVVVTENYLKSLMQSTARKRAHSVLDSLEGKGNGKKR